MPTGDPLWPFFERFVREAGVVRKDLLSPQSDAREQDWQIIWQTFKAGYMAGRQ